MRTFLAVGASASATLGQDAGHLVEHGHDCDRELIVVRLRGSLGIGGGLGCHGNDSHADKTRPPSRDARHGSASEGYRFASRPKRDGRSTPAGVLWSGTCPMDE